MSEALELRRNLPVSSMNDIAEMGNMIVQSGVFGGGSPARGFVIAATCVQEGMSLLEFKRQFHVSNTGDIMKRADRMLSDYIDMGGTIQWVQFDDKVAEAKFTYGANKDLSIKFTFEEAKKAGYVKARSNWEKDPASQLRARLISRAMRMICPKAANGSYTPEEMADVHGQAAESEAPQALDPVEAAKRVNSVQQPQPQPQATTEATPWDADAGDSVDCSVCPDLGPDCALTGIKWADMDVPTLSEGLKFQHPCLLPGHYDAIKQAIEAKGGAK